MRNVKKKTTRVTTTLEADVTINKQPLAVLRLAVRIIYGHTVRDIDGSQTGQIHKLHNTAKHRTASASTLQQGIRAF